MKIASPNIFTKTKGNALTSKEFSRFVKNNEINEFYIAGADACACVKSTCFNLKKENYITHVISDCVTNYDKKRINEMLEYYAKQGCNLIDSSVLLVNQ
jgi:nicotinamidase-related amidase